MTFPYGPSFDDSSLGKFSPGAGTQRSSTSIFDRITSPFRDSSGDFDFQKIIGAGTQAAGAVQQVGSMFGFDPFGFGPQQQPQGYQGKIPTYTATRMQVPNTYDPERRPGSGGQRYFTDVSFSGGDLSGQAAGLEALNRANIASRNRAGVPMPDVLAARQAAAQQAAAQQAAAQQAAQQPVQQMAQGGIAQFAAGRKVDAPESSDSPMQKVANIRSNKPITTRTMPNGRKGIFQGNVFLGYANEGISGSDITGAIGEQVDRLKEFGSGVLDKINPFEEGGIAQLKRPQYLSGDTDGMADEIDASIEGEQPAALSDGEFVIPADVVSHLGNGNSDAGAKVLEKMMARVRKARTGSTKQGKEIDPEEFLPA